MKFIPTTKDGENQDGIVSRFINPGGFFFYESNCQIHTILGSCISITLWHPKFKFGGMCHFVLADKPNGSHVKTPIDKFDGRYLEGAMALFEREAMRRRTKLKDYQAKMFGGSNMIASLSLKEDELVGTRNTEAAIKYLTKNEIPLLVADVGETGYRRIAFDVEKGDVWVKHEPLQKTIK